MNYGHDLDLHRLLASRRTKLPSEEYFKGVLPEFHRRLRVEQREQRSRVTLWQQLTEKVSEFFQPVPTIAWAGAAAILLSVSSFAVIHHSSATVVAQHHAPTSQYAFAEALDSHFLSQLDQDIDSASLEKVSAQSDAQRPHYVLAGGDASYDNALAF